MGRGVEFQNYAMTPRHMLFVKMIVDDDTRLLLLLHLLLLRLHLIAALLYLLGASAIEASTLTALVPCTCSRGSMALCACENLKKFCPLQTCFCVQLETSRSAVKGGSVQAHSHE